jgi:hypothetical protein
MREFGRSAGRLTAPLSRQLAGRRMFPLWAVMKHCGRRSGRHYAIPVAVGVTPAAFFVPMPWGEGTQWARNVMAAGGCTLRWRARDHVVTDPAVVGLADAGEAFKPWQRALMKALGVQAFMRLRRDPG